MADINGGLRAENSILQTNVCELCGTLENLLLCSGCKTAYYCSKEHQKTHWREHKKACKSSIIKKYLSNDNSHNSEVDIVKKIDNLSSSVRPGATTVISQLPLHAQNAIPGPIAIEQNTFYDNAATDWPRGSTGIANSVGWSPVQHNTLANFQSAKNQQQQNASSLSNVNINNETLTKILTNHSNNSIGAGNIKNNYAPVSDTIADISNLYMNQLDQEPRPQQQSRQQENIVPLNENDVFGLDTELLYSNASECDVSSMNDSGNTLAHMDPVSVFSFDPNVAGTAAAISGVWSPSASSASRQTLRNDPLLTSVNYVQNASSFSFPSTTECFNSLPNSKKGCNSHQFSDINSQMIGQKGKRTKSSTGRDMNKTTPTSQTDATQAYLAILRHRNKAFADYVVDCLHKHGCCVIDKFLGDAKGTEILNEMKRLHSSGVFTQGQLVTSMSNSTQEIRDDLIHWVDGTEPGCTAIRFLVSCMDAIVLECNGRLENYNINGRTKAMLACYLNGATGYKRHVDNPNQDGRCCTCIYYLNKKWNANENGGLLRIFPEQQNWVANIEPLFDRLLFFWSDRRNPHEVQPSYDRRYAITVWYYDSEERKQALDRVTQQARVGRPSPAPTSSLYNGSPP